LFSEKIQQTCKKYILFINKVDVLQQTTPESDEALDARAKDLYKKVIDSLTSLGKKYGATIKVVTGSAQTGRGCPELHKELLTDILPEAARDEALKYMPDATDAADLQKVRTVEVNL
jgi:GTPase Era involved in 16S rRNA processing